MIADIDVSVFLHLGCFHNIDLPTRGVYYIRATLTAANIRVAPIGLFSAPSTLESKAKRQTIPYPRGNLLENCEVEDIERQFKSRQFVIRYLDEKHELNDGVHWRLTVPDVDLHYYELEKITCPETLHIQFELMCCPLLRISGVDMMTAVDKLIPSTCVFDCVAEQSIEMHKSSSGTHAYYPIRFDKKHFVELDAMFHVCITGIRYSQNILKQLTLYTSTDSFENNAFNEVQAARSLFVEDDYRHHNIDGNNTKKDTSDDIYASSDHLYDSSLSPINADLSRVDLSASKGRLSHTPPPKKHMQERSLDTATDSASSKSISHIGDESYRVNSSIEGVEDDPYQLITEKIPRGSFESNPYVLYDDDDGGSQDSCDQLSRIADYSTEHTPRRAASIEMTSHLNPHSSNLVNQPMKAGHEVYDEEPSIYIGNRAVIIPTPIITRSSNDNSGELQSKALLPETIPPSTETGHIDDEIGIEFHPDYSPPRAISSAQTSPARTRVSLDPYKLRNSETNASLDSDKDIISDTDSVIKSGCYSLPSTPLPIQSQKDDEFNVNHRPRLSPRPIPPPAVSVSPAFKPLTTRLPNTPRADKGIVNEHTEIKKSKTKLVVNTVKKVLSSFGTPISQLRKVYSGDSMSHPNTPVASTDFFQEAISNISLDPNTLSSQYTILSRVLFDNWIAYKSGLEKIHMEERDVSTSY